VPLRGRRAVPDLALGWRVHRCGHPPADPPGRLTSRNNSDDRKKTTRACRTVHLARQAARPGRALKINPSWTPQATTSWTRKIEVRHCCCINRGSLPLGESELSGGLKRLSLLRVMRIRQLPSSTRRAFLGLKSIGGIHHYSRAKFCHEATVLGAHVLIGRVM
jgi:hypothetical protein